MMTAESLLSKRLVLQISWRYFSKKLLPLLRNDVLLLRKQYNLCASLATRVYVKKLRVLAVILDYFILIIYVRFREKKC